MLFVFQRFCISVHLRALLHTSPSYTLMYDTTTHYDEYLTLFMLNSVSKWQPLLALIGVFLVLPT